MLVGRRLAVAALLCVSVLGFLGIGKCEETVMACVGEAVDPCMAWGGPTFWYGGGDNDCATIGPQCKLEYGNNGQKSATYTYRGGRRFIHPAIRPAIHLSVWPPTYAGECISSVLIPLSKVIPPSRTHPYPHPGTQGIHPQCMHPYIRTVYLCAHISLVMSNRLFVMESMRNVLSNSNIPLPSGLAVPCG